MVQRYGSYRNLLLTIYELKGSYFLWEYCIRIEISVHLLSALRVLGFYMYTNYKLTGTAGNGPGGDIASRM